MKRAVIYARFSTENQKDASIDDQFRVCQRIIDREGLELVARFEDRGISGGTDQRPGYQALLSMARDKGFDVIVTEDISRLWRSMSEFGTRSAQLDDWKIHLITATGDDTRHQGWGLVLNIKQAVAAHLRAEIGHKTRRGLEGRALAGDPTGGRCYGYAGPAAIDEDQAAVVKHIFVEAAAGRSAIAIAACLNVYGIGRGRVCAPRGGAWRDSSVKAILRNRRYLGEITYGAHEVRGSAQDSKKKIRTKRAEPLSVRQVPELAIISQELFDKVQKVRTASLARKDWLCEPFSTANQPAHN